MSDGREALREAREKLSRQADLWPEILGLGYEIRRRTSRVAEVVRPC